MSFSLEFAPEFFLAEGEPYDRADLALNADGKPTSVWSAIEGARGSDFWENMARDVFGQPDGTFLNSESVLRKIQETDTCVSLTSPVRVYIDAKGDYSLEIYE